MQVVVTGAAGFLGSHLSSKLEARGWRVVRMSRTQNPGMLHCDLSNAAAVERIFKELRFDAVVHAAALSSAVSNDLIGYYRHNVIATENIMRSISNSNPDARVIFISTAGVYGRQEAEVLEEELIAHPVHHYGLSKLVCENLISNMYSDLRTTIVRPFNIIGQGQSSNFVIPKILSAFASRKNSIRLGNIDTFRDFIDVDSVCDILIDLLQIDRAIGELVNVCSGSYLSVRQVIDCLRDLTGHDIEVIVDTNLLRQNEIERLVGSRRKLEELIGRDLALPDINTIMSGMVLGMSS